MCMTFPAAASTIGIKSCEKKKKKSRKCVSSGGAVAHQRMSIKVLVFRIPSET